MGELIAYRQGKRYMCPCGYRLANVIVPVAEAPGWPLWPDGRPYDLEWSQRWTDRAKPGLLTAGRARRPSHVTLNAAVYASRVFPDATRAECPNCREILLLR